MTKYDHASLPKTEDPRRMASAAIAGAAGKDTCLAPRNTVLADMADFVESLNRQANEIEANLTAFGYRVSGVTPETGNGVSTPSPVPNGALQTVEYGLGSLQKVLDRLSEKVNSLNRLA